MKSTLTHTQLCTIFYKHEMSFGKNQAAKIVGSRTRLEKLVAEGRVRMNKPANAQNGKWQCNAGDVLLHAKYKS